VSVFEMADTDGSGTIDAKELARVLSVYSPFSPRTVRLMLHIYADNSYNTTSIGIPSPSNSLWVLSEHHIGHAGVQIKHRKKFLADVVGLPGELDGLL
jgi:hypothetical protein